MSMVRRSRRAAADWRCRLCPVACACSGVLLARGFCRTAGARHARTVDVNEYGTAAPHRFRVVGPSFPTLSSLWGGMEEAMHSHGSLLNPDTTILHGVHRHRSKEITVRRQKLAAFGAVSPNPDLNWAWRSVPCCSTQDGLSLFDEPGYAAIKIRATKRFVVASLSPSSVLQVLVLGTRRCFSTPCPTSVCPKLAAMVRFGGTSNFKSRRLPKTRRSRNARG